MKTIEVVQHIDTLLEIVQPGHGYNQQDVRRYVRAEVAERLLKCLKAIAKYEHEEVCKDDFAYDRMKAAFQEAALEAIKQSEEDA
jgi:hypothetical protein